MMPTTPAYEGGLTATRLADDGISERLFGTYDSVVAKYSVWPCMKPATLNSRTLR